MSHLCNIGKCHTCVTARNVTPVLLYCEMSHLCSWFLVLGVISLVVLLRCNVVSGVGVAKRHVDEWLTAKFHRHRHQRSGCDCLILLTLHCNRPVNTRLTKFALLQQFFWQSELSTTMKDSCCFIDDYCAMTILSCGLWLVCLQFVLKCWVLQLNMM